MLTWLFALALAQDIPGEVEAQLIRARVAAQPAAVREFIERRAMCNHFMGEEGYDRQRRRDLARAIRELRCLSIDRDEAALLRSFAARADTVALLIETRDILGW